MFWLVLIFAIVIRVSMVVNHPQGWDSIDFALGVERYDLMAMQPHFPGYPVYMLIAKGVNYFAGEPLWSLSLVSALFGGLTIIPFYGIAKGLLGRTWGLWAALVLTLSPLHWLLSEQAMSDVVGNFFVVSYFYLLLRALKAGEHRQKIAFLGSGALVIALGLGVRLSYFPYLIALIGVIGFWAYSSPRLGLKGLFSAMAAGILGVGIWLSWQISYDGANGLLEIAAIFTRGHFVDWGGTMVTAGNPVERLEQFLGQNLLGAGLGIYWPPGWSLDELFRWLGSLTFLLAGLLGLAAGKPNLLAPEQNLQAPEQNRPENSFNFSEWYLLSLWVLPYLVWVYVGQNAEKPRHIITLVPPLILLLTYGWQSLLPRLQPNRRLVIYIFLGFAVIGMGSTGWEQVSSHQAQASPMYQLAKFLGAHYPDPAGLKHPEPGVLASDPKTAVFTWEEERVIRYYYPDFNTIRLRKWEDLIRAVQGLPWVPNHLLFTSAVINGLEPAQKAQISKFLVPKVRFQGNPRIYPTYNELILYEVKPDFYSWALGQPTEK